MLIDSHHHLWKYSAEEYGWIGDSMSVLRADFQASELGMIADDSGVDGFVSVQARRDVVENDALIALAEDQSKIKGIVGWVPFKEAGVKSIIEKYTAHKIIKGFREVIQGEPDEDFFANDDFNRGIDALLEFDVVYDVLIFGNQLKAATEFVDRHPKQRFVLDHIAKPTIKSATPDGDWVKEFRELSRRENLDCKFSGVVTEVRDQAWTVDLIRPYWDVAIDAYGPERLMFGSDWPVCLLQSEYSQWLSAVRELSSDLSAEQQAQFFAGTADRAYRLNAIAP